MPLVGMHTQLFILSVRIFCLQAFWRPPRRSLHETTMVGETREGLLGLHSRTTKTNNRQILIGVDMRGAVASLELSEEQSRGEEQPPPPPTTGSGFGEQ